MSRDYQINGETLVMCKGSNLSVYMPKSTPLGLSKGPAKMTFTFLSNDVHVDDFANCPADIMANLATCTIEIPLIHYDPNVLADCMAHSQGNNTEPNSEGTLPGAGILLGGGQPIFSSECTFVSVVLKSSSAQPWRFRACHMPDQPVTIPLGTEASLTIVRFRALPYNPQVFSPGNSQNLNGSWSELTSVGAVLFDHQLDT